MDYAQRKLIMIHGWGGTFVDAVEQFFRLISFSVEWRDGVFRVPRSEGLALRRLLQHAEPDADGAVHGVIDVDGLLLHGHLSEQAVRLAKQVLKRELDP